MRLFFFALFLLQAGCSLSADAESTARKFVEGYYSAGHVDDLRAITAGRAMEKLNYEQAFRNHSHHPYIFFQLHDHVVIHGVDYFYFTIHFLEVDHERELCVTAESLSSTWVITDFYYLKD